MSWHISLRFNTEFIRIDNCRVKPVLGLGLWELPLSVQNFGPRPIKPHQVVPSPHNWAAVRDFAVATTEPGLYGPVGHPNLTEQAY
jgi:hypothetical protein